MSDHKDDKKDKKDEGDKKPCNEPQPLGGTGQGDPPDPN